MASGKSSYLTGPSLNQSTVSGQTIHPSSSPSIVPSGTSGSYLTGPMVTPHTTPVIQPTVPVVQPTNPVVQPTVPVVQPTVPVVQPTVPVVQPTVPVVQPTVPVVQPTAPVVQPTIPVVQPTVPVVQPTVPVVQPTVPVVQPTVPVVQPIISGIQPVVDPSLPIPSTQGLGKIPEPITKLTWPTIDHPQVVPRTEKDDILNNDPIEENLHVVAVLSNICEFKRRYDLTHEFISRMSREPNVILYVVELAYKNQSFHVTQKHNPQHLQLRTDIPLWHKENLINIGIRRLLPRNWKAVAWVDADIEFENPHWALDTLKILNGSKDVVQLFSHCINMDLQGDSIGIYSGFGFQHANGKPYLYNPNPDHYFHPGYGFAITRKAYEQIGGLYEVNILGSGDHMMITSFIGMGKTSLVEGLSQDFVNALVEFEKRAKCLRLGYVPGIIKHHFHGAIANRGYDTRDLLMVNYQFSPKLHLVKNEDGLLVPSSDCPKGFIDEVIKYFQAKQEDSKK